jgi:hypothetical protein
MPFSKRVFSNDVGRARARQQMWVDVPLCEWHRRYFWKRELLRYLPLILIIGLTIILAAVSQEGYKSAIDVLIAVIGIACLGWLIWVAMVWHRTIRPKEITEYSITLTNICDQFVTAIVESKEMNQHEESR